jgi:hypothetical protein
MVVRKPPLLPSPSSGNPCLDGVLGNCPSDLLRTKASGRERKGKHSENLNGKGDEVKVAM